MDGAFYNDTRLPFTTADTPAVALLTTLKALYPLGSFPALGSQYFALLGKRVRITVRGRITTALTPGNLVLSLLYGTGADANGVTLVSSAALALIASQANMTWEAIFETHCRGTGSAGLLFAMGRAHFNPAVIASTAQPIMIPAAAPVVSAAVDLTSSGILSVQASRSGSTAETMQVHDLEVKALN